MLLIIVAVSRFVIQNKAFQQIKFIIPVEMRLEHLLETSKIINEARALKMMLETNNNNRKK